ncbi:MAG TPA: hypothetical protein VJZ71_19305 [Phycisphaerae bacterium]|nr:hypothetical protein [Phycisphaerae bacterium]
MTRCRTTNLSLIALTTLSTLIASLPAQAGEATTSAGVTQIGSRPGTANATAAYTGEGRGRAQTTTRSGRVTLAEGLAFGVDRDGIDFSVSYAVAGRFAPALASTFNLSIGRDGSVASSGGLSVAGNAPVRSVNAGGFARSQPGGSISGATAGGRSDPHGTVLAKTWSESRRPLRTFRYR